MIMMVPMVIIVVNCNPKYQTQPSHSENGPNKSFSITPAFCKKNCNLSTGSSDYLENNGDHPGGDEEGVEPSEDVPIDWEDSGEVAEDATGHEDTGQAAHEGPKGAGQPHPNLQANELCVCSSQQVKKKQLYLGISHNGIYIPERLIFTEYPVTGDSV